DAGTTALNVTADALQLRALGSIGELGNDLNPLEINVNTLAARAVNGDISLLETNSVTVGSTDGSIESVAVDGTTETVAFNELSDLRTVNDGTIVLRTVDGSITLTGDTAVDAIGDGYILLEANGEFSDIVAQASVN